jgi:signal transduction histidine kinase
MGVSISSRVTRHFVLAVDALILIICLLHIPSISQRGHFPIAVSDQGEFILITEILSPGSAPLLSAGDKLLSVDGVLPRNTVELQFIADTKEKNSTVAVAAERDGQEIRTEIVLRPFYPNVRFILLTFFVGIIMLVLSGLLIFSIPHEPLVHYLHNIIVSLSAALMLTWGAMDDAVLTKIAMVLFFLSYILFGFIFLLFCHALWKPSVSISWWVTTGMYGAVILYAGWLSYLYLTAMTNVSLEQFRIFSEHLFVFRLFVVIAVCIGMAFLIATLGKKTAPEEATRIRWIIGGIVAGGLPYTLFGIIPVTFFGVDAFAEELSTLFFLLVPLCISVAFIRYNLLNLRSFVRRQRISTVFRLLLYCCVIFIAAVVAAHVFEREQFDSHIVIGLIAGISVAVLLSAGMIFEHYVDEKLFQTKLNFRGTLKDSIAQLHGALDDRSLFHNLLTVIHHHLPVRAASVFQSTNGSIHQVESIGQDTVPVEIKTDTIHLIEQHHSPVIQFNAAQEGSSLFDYAVVIRRPSGKLDALIGLYLEMRYNRLEDEDRDFLSSIAGESSQILERFRMQEEIILKKNEARRSEEMNALKSFFVSSVSHDLRLPLTSIHMYTEMLSDNGSYSRHKQKDFLRTILGETERLTRHVENILNINSIEQGKFRFDFTRIDLRLVIRRAVRAMRYEIKKQSAQVSVSLPSFKLIVSADETALQRVMMNLLSNAIKYSTTQPKISISVKRHSSSAVITIADNGIGIPQNEQKKIFEKFYRVRQDSALKQASGLGIGLAVVKYIVDQHKGTISLTSKVNKGSTFTITLPLFTS